MGLSQALSPHRSPHPFLNAAGKEMSPEQKLLPEGDSRHLLLDGGQGKELPGCVNFAPTRQGDAVTHGTFPAHAV